MDTNKIKKGLGRGLSSLIGETKIEININKVPISDLVSNKFQPRKTFDEESLQDLTNSIKERGIIQPIIVRKSSEDSTKYEIIAGERRWLSAQKAGLHEVPVVITDVISCASDEWDELGIPKGHFVVELQDYAGLGFCKTEEELIILYRCLTGEDIE